MFRYKKLVYIIILLFVALIALWGIPEIVRTATRTRSNYPFVYFSSIKKKFLLRESNGQKSIFRDDEGETLTEDEYDHALPLLNFRQLTVNGEMPDSIDGIAIDPRELRIKSMNFRYQPVEIHTPQTELYIMYESLPKKAKLESPGDVFRLDNKIEFIDDETNTVNKEKSEIFQMALKKAGYTFPAQWTCGNLSIRKPYDEGYFSLDDAGQLFHIKMVNGRPFVRNTALDKNIEPAHFSMLEVADKRFYGLLFDKKGFVYILEEGGGKYNPLRLEIEPMNIDKDELLIIGNMLYWTVTVQTSEGRHIYALDAATLQQLRTLLIEAPKNKFDVLRKIFFPVSLTFRKKTSDYIEPRLQ
ncbi:MAG: DUF4857 domain-containing protein [Dysgonamonadaceae bacterium]|jgi:hypothetical protein|nr:DUF4857 domain-containing protein [Dysgonamonadaceae bacterium]